MGEPSSSERTAATFAGAHPLAQRLFERLEGRQGPVIVVGDGRGRNSRALRAAGLIVVSIADEAPYTQLGGAAKTYEGALSTHAYLHGSSSKIRAGTAELARVLQPGAPAFLTFGSIQDVRYGFGDRIDAHTFAPGDGSEAGVPHAYFDRDGILEVLRPFTVVSAEEVAVDDIIGKWAHLDEEPPGKVHWFVEVRRP